MNINNDELGTSEINKPAQNNYLVINPGSTWLEQNLFRHREHS